MAYSTSLRAEARELYFAGSSALKIAAEMKGRYPDQCKRLSEKTVLSWIATPDPVTKKTWLDLKNEALAQAADKQVEGAANEFSKLHGALQKLTDICRKRLEDAASHPSSNADYTAQVFLQVLSKRFELLSSATVTGIGSEGQIELFMQVLKEDPELGPVFLRRREALSKAYRDKLRETGADR